MPCRPLGRQSRASCVVCLWQSPQALIRAARHNAHLAQLYELAESLMGHYLRVDLAMRDVLAPAGIAPLPRDWPLEDLVLGTADGVGAALALAVPRGAQPMPRLP
jgi:hypothetical protein